MRCKTCGTEHRGIPKHGGYCLEHQEQRAEAAEVRAASALRDKWRIMPDENGDGGETWRAAFADCDMQRMSAEAERDAAQAELRAICTLLDDGGNGVSNTALDMVKRMQAALDAARHEAWIERM